MTHTDSIELPRGLKPKPFILQIGRKRQRINKPARLEAEQQFAKMSDDGPIVPISQSYRLFIDNKLFASVLAYPRRRYERAPITLIKPKRGLMEIRLVKKRVTLH